MSTEPVLTDADERLLALLREHAIDAEVAVRLGVPVGDVKDRIARLQGKLGVGGRKELAAWAPSSVRPTHAGAQTVDTEPPPPLL